MGLSIMASRAIRALSRATPALRRGFATEAASTKLTFSLVLPDKAIYEKSEVDLVIVPGTSGAFGIMKDHVPTIAQLDAGLVTVHGGDGGEDSYFVSGGFAIIKEDRADVCVVEAVKVEDLDASEVSKGLADAQSKLSSANDDLSRAEAQISVSTYMAMQSAIDAK